MSKRDLRLAIINKNLSMPGISAKRRAVLVILKLELMGYNHG